MRKPFYRKQTKCWYVKGPNDEFIRLDPDENKAFKIWEKMRQLADQFAPRILGRILPKLRNADNDLNNLNVTPKKHPVVRQSFGCQAAVYLGEHHVAKHDAAVTSQKTGILLVGDSRAF